MALGALTLSVTQGIAGREFLSKVAGLTAGTIVEMADGSTPGMGYANGFVSHPALPSDLSVAILRERVQTTGESRITRMLVSAVSPYVVEQQAIASGVIRGFRSAGVKQSDGSLAYQLFVEDALGATVVSAVNGVAPPVVTTPVVTPTPTPAPAPTPTPTASPSTVIFDSLVQRSGQTYTFTARRNRTAGAETRTVSLAASTAYLPGATPSDFGGSFPSQSVTFPDGAATAPVSFTVPATVQPE